LSLAAEERTLMAGMRECNWLQALEGDIDTAHLSFLHMGAATADDFPVTSPAYYFQKSRNPDYKITDTEYGTMYGAFRVGDAGEYYWRVAHFLMPFWTMPPGGPIDRHVIARAWVPIDDEHTMFWQISPSLRGRAPVALVNKNGKPLAGISFFQERQLPNTTDWLGRFRYVDNATNDYSMDRNRQRSESFTGIEGVHLQDQSVTESMGPIVDRTREHLGHSDGMIMRTRRCLLKAALDLERDNTLPQGVDAPHAYWSVRSGEMITAAGADWLESYCAKLAGMAPCPRVPQNL